MQRREFITLLGGVATAWPFAALAQQADRVRRIGVFMNLAANDPEASKEMAAFLGGLQELGWIRGGNLQIEYRWGAGDSKLYPRYAAELVALAPDIMLASGGTTVGALQQATSTVPIVFVNVTDPVNRGLVSSLARPGGNASGFIQFEYSLSGKWLELLKQIAPGVTRAAVIRDPSEFSGVGQFAAIQTVAQSLGVEVNPVDARAAGEIERAVTAFARGSNSGLIVTASGAAAGHRKLIITLAARYRLPAVYSYRFDVADGGLISYGPDVVDQFRRAAGYVDRILKGEKPADLPVQAPTKYQLVINLKTAKALGLDIPQTILSRADEVIE
ncbi:MAG TPA: ABC transporter substrate-binding protein [Pseudolabrys sp.]|nr:ABC transporter substrate-binding protein [Pseudolabrys sp.]